MKTERMRWTGLVALIGALAVGGCSSSGPARPAMISHVVLIELSDPSLAGALIADCDRHLTDIKEVRSYASGQHLDTGRATVQSDYDVGLYIGFDSVEDYARYVEHPLHVELVDRWRSRIARMRVYDIGDPTP
ncbi:MAG: Dabb family protein [Phycisphaeraceae bacterium]|nr:Dabb family protein [Phycisphaeraceae bacterium]MCW5762164.1 Dabb family protein [Phycisphaeraceae bacterium]